MSKRNLSAKSSSECETNRRIAMGLHGWHPSSKLYALALGMVSLWAKTIRGIALYTKPAALKKREEIVNY